MKNEEVINKWILIVLRVSAFTVFIGRAYQHLFWDAPFRVLLWDQDLLEGLVASLFNVTWNEYATSPMVDAAIDTSIRVFGVFYLVCALLSVFIGKKHFKLGKVFLVGSGALTFLSLLYCKEKFFHIGQFFEYSLQIASPVLLYGFLFEKISKKKILLVGFIASGLTFVCHGLYAIAYYPRPGTFVDMTIRLLQVEEPVAHLFLWLAGLLDFIVVIGLFLKLTRTQCLLYMIAWGTLTALARVISGVYISFFWTTLHQNLMETVFRLPHGLIPLVLFLMLYSDKGLRAGSRAKPVL